MKLKVTKKEIRNQNQPIIKIHYCKAQFLLFYKYPFAYSEGMYGWTSDYYEINGCIISTGYDPIGQNIDFHFLSFLDRTACDILHDDKIDPADKSEMIDELLLKLIKEVNK